MFLFRSLKNVQVILVKLSLFSSPVTSKWAEKVSCYILSILKESSLSGVNYNPNFTMRTYFNQNLVSSDFFASIEKTDTETEKVAFKLFFMSASSCSYNSAPKKKGKTRNSILQEDLAFEFSNLNLDIRRNLLPNESSCTITDFETAFIENPDELRA